MNPMLPANIAVIGPGLIGGSLLLALRKRRPALQLSAWARRAEAVDEIKKIDGSIAASTDLRKTASGADLIV
ncbi:MAG TPA: hypothetical protein VGH65_07150, partial [Verrucomicrobiaceae bacterium]